MSKKNNEEFNTIEDVATHLRKELQDEPGEEGKKDQKIILLFAYNGTGKTRISTEFKDQGKQNGIADTLYFNAFTGDLFTWDNDLKGDSKRKLMLNEQSKFFNLLRGGSATDFLIRSHLDRYADFDFEFDWNNMAVSFSRKIKIKKETEIVDNIKISRGEENLFIWCFFLVVVQLIIDKSEIYHWVDYIYIDDPVSSLDENNTVAIAHYLAQLLKHEDNKLKIVISSHHTLFFNVLCNELNKSKKYFLKKNKKLNRYFLSNTTDTPFFYHVAMLAELKQASDSRKLYTYHFNILRTILEKTASFHGYELFSDCIRVCEKGSDKMHRRFINILSHGKYSLYEPREMLEDSKDVFSKILNDFLNDYKFNEKIFPKLIEKDTA